MTANLVIAQLLHLESQDAEKVFSLYIYSPGGEVYSGLAILDTMNYIKPDVSTICVGMAASMAAVLLAAGAPGKRFSLPHSKIMIHQPSGGAQGQQTEIEIADRIVFLGEEVNSVTANLVIAQLLHLESQDAEKDISLYINSPGGEVYSGLAILDTMNYIKPDVSTICVGMAASMAAVLLAAGAPGKRFSLPHSKIMIHQPSGGAQGQQTEIEIAAREIRETRNTLNQILDDCTGKTFELHQARRFHHLCRYGRLHGRRPPGRRRPRQAFQPAAL